MMHVVDGGNPDGDPALAQRLIPNLRRVDLEGGHSINIEQSDEFNQAVLSFTADNR